PPAKGPSAACVVDKIDQFAAELGNQVTSASEQLLALKFLLHFVGDLHQPLHASDQDAGGNKKLVTGDGLRPARSSLSAASKTGSCAGTKRSTSNPSVSLIILPDPSPTTRRHGPCIGYPDPVWCALAAAC